MAGWDAFDVVIVGGGAAGCVVAARLAESPSRSGAALKRAIGSGPETSSTPNAPAGVIDLAKQNTAGRPILTPAAGVDRMSGR